MCTITDIFFHYRNLQQWLKFLHLAVGVISLPGAGDRMDVENILSKQFENGLFWFSQIHHADQISPRSVGIGLV